MKRLPTVRISDDAASGMHTRSLHSRIAVLQPSSRLLVVSDDHAKDQENLYRPSVVSRV